MIQKGQYYKRREIKKDKIASINFIEIEHDKATGKRVGWMLVDSEDKGDKWHMEALKTDLKNGTYELCGPKVQGNPEGYKSHILIKHSNAEQFEDAPRSYEGIKEWFAVQDIEGIVFHHPDGRMGKIKKKDFGLKRI